MPAIAFADKKQLRNVVCANAELPRPTCFRRGTVNAAVGLPIIERMFSMRSAM